MDGFLANRGEIRRGNAGRLRAGLMVFDSRLVPVYACFQLNLNNLGKKGLFFFFSFLGCCYSVPL